MASTCQRTLAFVEIFAGAVGTARNLRVRGYEAQFSDKETGHQSEDISLLAGILHAGRRVLSVMPRGFLHLSPQCRSWLRFVNAATSKRTLDNILGDSTVRGVEEGNVTAMIVLES